VAEIKSENYQAVLDQAKAQALPLIKQAIPQITTAHLDAWDIKTDYGDSAEGEAVTEEDTTTLNINPLNSLKPDATDGQSATLIATVLAHEFMHLKNIPGPVDPVTGNPIIAPNIGQTGCLHLTLLMADLANYCAIASDANATAETIAMVCLTYKKIQGTFLTPEGVVQRNGCAADFSINGGMGRVGLMNVDLHPFDPEGEPPVVDPLASACVVCP